jgi:hypothetical protein
VATNGASFLLFSRGKDGKDADGNSPFDAAMADGLEVMDIARRGNLTTSFNVNAGDTLYWKFAVKNYDIDFKVKRGRGVGGGAAGNPPPLTNPP